MNVQQLKQLLEQSDYDKVKSLSLVNQFTRGFDLGYRGPINQKDQADNIPIRGVSNPVDRRNKIMKEVKGHRCAHPFIKPHMDNLIQSPYWFGA